MVANQLNHETSPYLLQHKDNPVHWMAWSDKAFEQAKRDDKPVLLSIGYAACHWCHVMAHESFEDQETADLMNANFINIKVDREERPDVDKVYMAALHSLGQQGGWPLTMFLTPAAEPFWGGTYFPPEPRYGRPSFKQVLIEISRIWQTERHRVSANTSAVLAVLNRETAGSQSTPETPEIRQVAKSILALVDFDRGGLKGAPKFPQSPIFEFLWSASLHLNDPRLAEAVITTATSISQGGIYDHLGGGIARYSVDDHWLVPHFEKMLYDNAQFVSHLARLWLKTHSPLFRCRIEETVNFILSDLSTPEGLFASSLDADSEGHEGRFYVWSKAEIDLVLGRAASETFCRAYSVTEEGNWEGSNILHRNTPGLLEESLEQQLHAARIALKSRRIKRVWPQRDHKVLADWNGLAIGALAEAAFVIGRPDWASLAQTAMSNLLRIHWQDGRLLHASTGDRARHEATVEDYAYLIGALRSLHFLTGNSKYIDTAGDLAKVLIEHHWTEPTGGFHFASKRVTELPVRARQIYDDVTPNANALMIANFVSLNVLTGQIEYLEKAHRISEAFASEARNSPVSAATFYRSCLYLTDVFHVTTVGNPGQALLREVVNHTGLDMIAHRLAATHALPSGHLASSQFAGDQTSAIYLCRGNTCAAPIRNQADLQLAVQSLNFAV